MNKELGKKLESIDCAPVLHFLITALHYFLVQISVIILQTVKTQRRCFEKYNQHKSNEIEIYEEEHRYDTEIMNAPLHDWLAETNRTDEIFPGRPKGRPELNSVPLRMMKMHTPAKNTIPFQVNILLVFLRSSANTKIQSCCIYLLHRGAKVLVQYCLSCYSGSKGCHECAIMIMSATWKNQYYCRCLG